MSFKKIKLINYFDNVNSHVKVISINDRVINEFNNYYKTLKYQVDSIDDNNLNDYFKSLSNYYNQLRTTLNNFDKSFDETTYDTINNLFERIALLSEDKDIIGFLKDYGMIISKIKNAQHKNLLKKRIDDLIKRKENKQIAIVKFSWQEVEDIQAENVDLLKFSEYLQCNKIYDIAILIGSPDYYRTRNPILTSVHRAKNIYYMHYNVFASNFNMSKLIKDNLNDYSKLYQGYSLQIIKDIEESKVELDTEVNEFIIESDNQNHLVQEVIDNYKQKALLENEFNATGILLGNNRVLFHPQKSKVRFVNKETLTVELREIHTLKKGDWLLNRISTTDNYLEGTTSEIYGHGYHEALNKVTKYKRELYDLKMNIGSLRELRMDLLLNNIKVEEQLLKQWIFGDTIAPRNYKDILSYLNYDEGLIVHLNTIKNKIYASRKKAGRKMLNDLTAEVQQYTFDEINESIYLNNLFEFDVDNQGEFTIDKVKEVIKETLVVGQQDMYKPIDILKDTTNNFETTMEFILKDSLE